MPRKAKPASRRASSATTKTARKRTTKPSPRERVAKAKTPRKRVVKAKTALEPKAKPKRNPPALTTKLSPRKRVAKAKKAPEPQAAKPKRTPPAARPIQRTSDVPIDQIAEWYTPKQTSLRASFRSDGADLENDQENPLGDGDGFQDEDHFTNRSGDIRIGTHGRTYQPAEARAPIRR